MTNLRTAQVAIAAASLALLGFDLAGGLGPDKPEWVGAIVDGGDTDTNAAPAGAALDHYADQLVELVE